VGGSILSTVYPPGSVDVTELQLRTDVLTFTTEPLEDDLDVVGPLSLVLYASSDAVDTDFVARLSDVFPDGRAIQLQTGIVRGRFRDTDGDPALLEPGTIYRLEIGMAATANRFAAGGPPRGGACSGSPPPGGGRNPRPGAGPPAPRGTPDFPRPPVPHPPGGARNGAPAVAEGSKLCQQPRIPAGTTSPRRRLWRSRCANWVPTPSAT